MPLAVELWGSCLSWCVSPDNAHDYACISRSMCSVLRSATIWRGTVADTRNVPVTQLEPPARWPFGQCKAIIASAPAVVSLSRYGVPVYLGWQGHFPGHLLHDAWAPLRPGVNYFMSDTDLPVRDVPVTVTVQWRGLLTAVRCGFTTAGAVTELGCAAIGHSSFHTFIATSIALLPHDVASIQHAAMPRTRFSMYWRNHEEIALGSTPMGLATFNPKAACNEIDVGVALGSHQMSLSLNHAVVAPVFASTHGDWHTTIDRVLSQRTSFAIEFTCMDTASDDLFVRVIPHLIRLGPGARNTATGEFSLTVYCSFCDIVVDPEDDLCQRCTRPYCARHGGTDVLTGFKGCGSCLLDQGS